MCSIFYSDSVNSLFWPEMLLFSYLIHCLYANIFVDLFQWLEQICGRVSDLGAFGDKRANHVLVNEYQPGQGIMVNIVPN